MAERGTRLSPGGRIVYAGMAGWLAYETVRLVRLDLLWTSGWLSAGIPLMVAAAVTGLLYAASAVTAIPLTGRTRDWLGRYGFFVVTGLTLTTVGVVYAASLQSFALWPSWFYVTLPATVDGCQYLIDRELREREQARRRPPVRFE